MGREDGDYFHLFSSYNIQKFILQVVFHLHLLFPFSFFSSSLLFFVSISQSVLVIFILFFIFSVTIFINFFYSCLTILVTTLHALLCVFSSCSFSSIFVSSFSIILILLFIVNVITTHTHRGVPRPN